MTYTVVVRVYQTNPNAFFHVVEKTVWHYANAGTWSESNGTLVLTMGGSGTSGTLRFIADTGEIFLAVLGVHNYDVAADLAVAETGKVANAEYYAGGKRSGVPVQPSCSVNNASGWKISVNFMATEGSDLKANIVIG
jgi:Fungal fruit body lectin